MKIRLLLFFRFLWACICFRVKPWNYFQLNAAFFNREKKMFSKLDMDELIPAPWRLNQYVYHPDRFPESYPVFIKPEWGQNARGIVRVHNPNEYLDFLAALKKTDIPFLVQEAACAANEYEIYYLRSNSNKNEYGFLSVVRVKNQSNNGLPINSIHNPDTGYEDITGRFSSTDLDRIWSVIKQIGDFKMARVGVKANSIQELLNKKFKVVEINLFLPMPLVLLSDNVNETQKYKIVKKTMTLAAKLVKQIPKAQINHRIFFQKMTAHFKVKK